MHMPNKQKFIFKLLFNFGVQGLLNKPFAKYKYLSGAYAIENSTNYLIVQSIKCQVKIGSNYLTVNVDKQTLCQDFLYKCLSRCKLSNCNLHKSYSLIERCNGIERFVRFNENVFELIKNFHNDKIPFELVIKKTLKSKKLLMTINKNKKYANKIFKLLSKQATTKANRNTESHFYEDIQDLSNSHRVSIQSEKPKRVVYSLKTIQSIRRKLQAKKIFDQEFIL
ncbi:hypothetical protein BpHYR1_009018 [Brachionus plicatilis]|uniref:Ras-associating domain-containing protein n=1 Tax=Brachionus plicatilis TaxID=10195 RepID=A0A3M7QD22_BRAPC|nr:hypothetical protein BpHYR1_009018 [Brachionus plicatilis]